MEQHGHGLITQAGNISLQIGSKHAANKAFSCATERLGARNLGKLVAFFFFPAFVQRIASWGIFPNARRSSDPSRCLPNAIPSTVML